MLQEFVCIRVIDYGIRYESRRRCSLRAGLRKLLQKTCAIGRRAALTDATLRAYRYKLDASLDRAG